MAYRASAFIFLQTATDHYCWPAMTQTLSWVLGNIKIVVVWFLFSKDSQSWRETDKQIVQQDECYHNKSSIGTQRSQYEIYICGHKEGSPTKNMKGWRWIHPKSGPTDPARPARAAASPKRGQPQPILLTHHVEGDRKGHESKKYCSTEKTQRHWVFSTKSPTPSLAPWPNWTSLVIHPIGDRPVSQPLLWN